jgi:putative methionine-R-sulfoxide reductase with GAF domain
MMQQSYEDLLSDIDGLFAGEDDFIANAANAAAAIWQHMPDINWTPRNMRLQREFC